jgi:hypothetical protein
MAYKTFVAGEEALAADVNSYLMGQAVPRFTSAAQRTSQLAAPVVNQLSILDSGKGIPEFWNGSAWVPLGIAYEKFFTVAPNTLLAAGDTTVTTFTTPHAGYLVANAIARIEPGSAGGTTVVLVSFSNGSVPAPSAAPVELAALLAPNAYRASIPCVGTWNAVPAGTAVTLKVYIQSSSGPGSEIRVAQVSGSVRLMTGVIS